MKPLCPDCGDRHESYQAHVWRKVANKVVANEVDNGFPLIPPPQCETVCVTRDKPIVMVDPVPRETRYKDPEKRRLYMRDLMRKRRAESSR